MTEIAIRILYRNQDGNIDDMKEEYDLADFGGIFPAVGDRIVDPGVVQGRDRREPENRTIWTVEERYFQPRTDPDAEYFYMYLVVSMRSADESERLVACRA